MNDSVLRGQPLRGLQALQLRGSRSGAEGLRKQEAEQQAGKTIRRLNIKYPATETTLMAISPVA
jgi:hypothetical protein